MYVEVDMSGKIEDTTKDTVIAYSDHETRSILIPSVAKRHLMRKYGKYYKKRVKLYIKIFSISLFFLLKKRLKSIELIIIDKEYVGYENDIKGILLNFIRKIDPNFNKNKIVFTKMGKTSKAHELALRTLRDEIPETEVISEKRIEKLL